DLPRRLQIEFSHIIQQETDSEGGEVEPGTMWEIFDREYLGVTGPLQVHSHHISSADGGQDVLKVDATVRGERRELEGRGNGPVAAFVDAIARVGFELKFLDYSEHALTAGDDAQAAAYVECAIGG